MGRSASIRRLRVLRERADSALLQAGVLPSRRRGNGTLVLFHNTMFGDPVRSPPGLPAGFELSSDLRRFAEARAVVFHIPSLGPIPRLRKHAGQLWVAWWMECEQHVPRLVDAEFMSRFDLTMSHRRDADVFSPYFREFGGLRLRTAPRPKRELAALFMSGAKDRSGRAAYAAELMRHLEVHSYGRRLRNRRLPVDRGPATKLDTIARYRFTLAFENAIATDYVTEKLYEPLAAGSVPVYLGAPNVEQLVPSPDCYIDVTDYDSPKALAERLIELGGDEDAYQARLKWKRRPFEPAFQEMLEQQRSDVAVRLCEAIRRIDAP